MNGASKPDARASCHEKADVRGWGGLRGTTSHCIVGITEKWLLQFGAIAPFPAP